VDLQSKIAIVALVFGVGALLLNLTLSNRHKLQIILSLALLTVLALSYIWPREEKASLPPRLELPAQPVVDASQLPAPSPLLECAVGIRRAQKTKVRLANNAMTECGSAALGSHELYRLQAAQEKSTGYGLPNYELALDDAGLEDCSRAYRLALMPCLPDRERQWLSEMTDVLLRPYDILKNEGSA
jgi:hypothetical protein